MYVFATYFVHQTRLHFFATSSNFLYVRIGKGRCCATECGSLDGLAENNGDVDDRGEKCSGFYILWLSSLELMITNNPYLPFSPLCVYFSCLVSDKCMMEGVITSIFFLAKALKNWEEK